VIAKLKKNRIVFLVMNLNLKQRLKYCEVCTHGDFNLQKGLLCTLTSQKPDFIEKCSQFILSSKDVVIPDFTVKEEIKTDEEQYLESINTMFSDNYSLSEFHNKKFSAEELNSLPDTYKFKYSKLYAYFHIVLGIVSLFGSAYLFVNGDNIISNLVYIPFVLGIGLFFFYLGYIKLQDKYSPNYISFQGVYLSDNTHIQ